ncbi:MAG: hypothetical protein M5R41_11435 [Bacteroidia bacterium]|nr:hypothetical protein [Bacteroidia bacterium]
MDRYTAEYFSSLLNKIASQKKFSHEYLLVPEAALLDDRIMKGKPFRGYNKENALFLLHLITSVELENPWLQDDDGWVPLMSTRIEEVIPHNHAKIFRMLEDFGWVEINRTYISTDYADALSEKNKATGDGGDVKAISMRYRIAPAWKDSPLTPVRVKRQHIWLFRLHTGTEGMNLEDLIQNHEYGFLAKWLSQLSIDIEGVSRHLAELYSSADGGHLTIGIPRRMRLHAVCELVSGRIRFSQDDFGHRIHSNITSLPRDLRPFLRLNGATLANIDLKNSQPMLLAALLRGNIRKTPLEFLSEVGIEAGSKEYETFLKTIRLLQRIDTEESDIRTYCDLVREGRFYEDFIERLRSWNPHDPNASEYENVINRLKKLTKYKTMDRDQVKREVMVTLFSSNRHIGYKPDADMKNRFREFFPDVYSVIRKLKEGEKNRLARFLQRSESMVVLAHTCKRLHELDPEIPLLTIHDSISTTKEHAEIVKQVLLEEVEKFVGFEPTVSIDDWH